MYCDGDVTRNLGECELCHDIWGISDLKWSEDGYLYCRKCEPFSMDGSAIIERLKQGEELHNHGCGWWVGPPSQPYKTSKKYKVEDSVVEDLKRQGKIKVSIPYTSARAELV